MIPDKLEQLDFARRMESLKSLCALDLRGVTQEFSKIRSNKYYTDGGVDDNAFVVYSDVIKALPDGLIGQIFDTNQPPSRDFQPEVDQPLRVATGILRYNGTYAGPYREGEAGALRTHEQLVEYSPSPEDPPCILSISCDDFEEDIFVELSRFGLNADIPPQQILPRASIHPQEYAAPSDDDDKTPLDEARTYNARRMVHERWRQSAQRFPAEPPSPDSFTPIQRGFDSAHDLEQMDVFRATLTRIWSSEQLRPQLTGMIAELPGLRAALLNAPDEPDTAYNRLSAGLSVIRDMQQGIAAQFAAISEQFSHLK